MSSNNKELLKVGFWVLFGEFSLLNLWLIHIRAVIENNSTPKVKMDVKEATYSPASAEFYWKIAMKLS